MPEKSRAGGSVPLREPWPPGERGRGEGREDGVGGRGGEGELGFSHSLSRSLVLKGPCGTTGWARGPRQGFRGRRLGEGERQPRTGGEGGGAGLFLNSASTRSLALWFLRVVYSIFLFLRRPSTLRMRGEARGLVGSGNARGSPARRPAPGRPRACVRETRGPQWRSRTLLRLGRFSRDELFCISSYCKARCCFLMERTKQLQNRAWRVRTWRRSPRPCSI